MIRPIDIMRYLLISKLHKYHTPILKKQQHSSDTQLLYSVWCPICHMTFYTNLHRSDALDKAQSIKKSKWCSQ